MDLGLIGRLLVMAAGTISVGALVFAIARAVRAANEKLLDDWALAGRELGLTLPTGGFFQSPTQLEGLVDGLEVRVKGQGGKHSSTEYCVKIPLPFLRMTAEGFSSAIGKMVSGEDVLTGDQALDEKALLRGDDAEILALFDAPTRAAAIQVLALGGSVMNGEISYRTSSLETSRPKLVSRTRVLLALGRRLAASQRVPVADRLAALATGDPLPTVRRRALTTLILNARADRAQRELVAGAVERALEDVDPENRLIAATSGRADAARSREVLERLARDSKTPDALQANAIVALGKFEGVADADVILDAVLERGGNEALIAAIGALALRRCDSSRVTPFATRPHAPTRAAVARALERIKDLATQPVLLSMFDDGDEDVRMAVIKALGALADVGAVERLLPLTQGLFGGGELRVAAQSAISRIQSRVSGAGAGQLSVSDAPADAGALSPVGDEGALSEVEAPPRPIGRKAPA